MDRMDASFAVWMASALLLAGCATNGLRFSETITDPVTGSVTTTEMATSSLVTWGSELEQGSGSVDYAGPDWRLQAGAAAAGARAGDASELIARVVSALVPVLAQPGVSEPNWVERLVENEAFVEALAERLRGPTRTDTDGHGAGSSGFQPLPR